MIREFPTILDMENQINDNPIGVEIPQDQLKQALLELDDLMHRTTMQEQYILLGETARALVEQLFLPQVLEAGLERRYLTKEVLTTFDQYCPEKKVTAKGIEFVLNGVLIKFQFIEKKYEFFKYPQRIIYGPEDYQVPNQWDKYWKARHIIK